MSRSRVLAQVLGLAVAAAGFAVAPQVSAAPAPQVDQLIRPCFGVLTEPNIKDCERRGGRGGKGDGKYAAGAIYVRCSADPARRPITAAIARARTGAVIVVHATDQACVESVRVTKSVWIQSDAGGDRVSGVTLRPADGRPCIEIAPGVRDVKISGLTIDASNAGAASCITATDTDLLIADTAIRYAGEGSAVEVRGGRLRYGLGSSVRARTQKGAIDAEGAIVEIDDALVQASFTGLDVTPGPGVNRIRNLRMRAMNDAFDDATAGPSTGMAIRGSGEGWLKVEDAVVCGFRTGVYADRGAVAAFLGDTKVCRSEVGFVAQGARLRVQDADVGASDTGLLAADGALVELYGNRIYGVARSGVYNDNGARLWSEDNRFYPYGRKCSEFGNELLTSGLMCRSSDELPAFYLAERETGAGRFDNDTRWYGVDTAWKRERARDGFDWSDDWASRPPGRGGRDRSRW